MNAVVDICFDRQRLSDYFTAVRGQTGKLCEPLSVDDFQIQSIVQTSPPKWHIAHVTWFFETFILKEFESPFRVFDPTYDYLFNSYYFTHGEMLPRGQRGMLSRPKLGEVWSYRAYVDEKMINLIHSVSQDVWERFSQRVILGLHHEQQHQELLLMDVKHNFFTNPLKPAYRNDLPRPLGETRAIRWLDRPGGIQCMGSHGEAFSYDNETPRHEVIIRDHRLADRFITNGEYLEFINDGGYSKPEFWMSDGWALIQSKQWNHPLYWIKGEGKWTEFTLGGVQELDTHSPVCHISFYEADAFARWSGKRLPTEEELETLLETTEVQGNFVEGDYLHPVPAASNGQWYGDLWAWTASPYSGYPGFTPLEGSMGEYNGKFMSNQMVLKGGACVTPQSHCRASYRNFFYPDERWPFTGLRLAESI